MVMTFAELAGLPGRGACCVLLLPPGESRVIGGLDAQLRPKRGFAAFRPAENAKAPEVRKELLRILRGAVTHLLLDFTPLSAQKGSELFLSLVDDIRKRHVRGWCFLPATVLEHRPALAVKERADLLASVDATGEIHFISAAGIVRPDFFLPKRLVTDPAEAAPPSADEVLLNALPAALVVFDASGAPVQSNALAATEFGFDVPALSQRPLASLVAKDSARHLLRCLASLRSGGSADARLTILDRQRRRRGVDLRARRLPDGRIACLVRETDEGEILQELEGNAELLNVLLDRGPAVQGIFRGLKLLRASRAFTELVDWLGLPGEFDMNSLLGKRGVEFRKSLADAGTAAAEITLVNREGEERHFELSASVSGTGRQTLTHLVLHDVTGRDRALKKLEESENLARELAAATAAGLVVVREGKCSWANRAALEMLGFGTAAEIAEKEFVEICGTRYRDQVHHALTGEATEQQLEIRMLQKAGGSIPVDLRVRPISTGHACILHDVTPVRKLKSDLRRAYQQQEIISPFMRALAGSLDPAHIAATATESLKKDLKFDAAALLLLRNERAIVASSYGLSAKAAEVLSAQIPGEGVLAYLEKTLEPVVTSVEAYPAFLPLKALWEGEGYGTVIYAPLTSGGRLYGLLVMLGKDQEVDEEWPWLFGTIGVFLGEALGAANMFQELKEQEALYHQVFSALPDITYRCRANGSVEILSPRMEQLFGHRIADFVRDPEFWRSVVHPDDRAEYSRRVAGQQSGSEGFELYYRVLPKGKAVYRWVRDTGRYQKEADGSVSGIVGTLAIVTGPPAGPAQADRSPAVASEDEFASIVSHDLKESLITIEAYSRIVREEAELQPDMAEHLDRVVAASGRLKNLIDDLATLSRVGRDGGAHQTFSLHKILVELQEEFEPTLRLRSATLVIPPDAPVVAYDRTQLTMVLRNLVSNGLKFNRSPEPRVEITVQERDEEIQVGVHDNGIGILPEDREKIFVIFRRLHPSSEFPGTGAGLAIVRKIVERHGGRVWVESEKGSSFYFTVPSRRSGS